MGASHFPQSNLAIQTRGKKEAISTYMHLISFPDPFRKNQFFGKGSGNETNMHHEPEDWALPHS